MLLADPQTREEWLECRRQGIGGSDAGCIIGANPWRSARQLWQEKFGRVIPEDIGDKPAVRFGKKAEQYIRALFLLEHPEYTCEYHEFRMYANDRLPWLYATLDGELTGASGRRGVLEIKTTTIRTASRWNEWDGRLPQHYYIQILHQLLACEWAAFAVLRAYIIYTAKDGERRAQVRDYYIERADVTADMEELEHQETAFWQSVQDGIEPPYILPEI